MSPASPHHGIAASTARSSTVKTAKVLLALVPRSTWTCASISIPRPRKQSARADDQDGEKGEMSGEDLPGRIERRTEGLGDAEHHAADQRPPQAAEAADDHRLKGEDKPDRSR